MKILVYLAAIMVIFNIANPIHAQEEPQTILPTPPKPDSSKLHELPGMLVLEPVDLSSGQTAPALGDKLRELFRKTGKWSVQSRQEIATRYNDYNQSISTPCKEYTCAFDVANIFHSPFVLYSTFTRLTDLYAFNMVIIDVLGTRIAWSHTGEVLMGNGSNREEALIYMLENIVTKVEKSKFIGTDVASKGALGIINFNHNLSRSNIIADRLATHLAASGQFDIMSQQELAFMQKTLKVSPSEFTDQNMSAVGNELGLDFLIYSRLNQDTKGYNVNLALYDVQKKLMVRNWPYFNENFRKILAFEDKFSASLNKTEAEFSQDVNGSLMSKWASQDYKTLLKNNWKWLASPAAFLTGVGLFYIGNQIDDKADRQFRRYQDANTLEELEQRKSLKNSIESKDRTRNFLFGLGILSLTGSILVWTF